MTYFDSDFAWPDHIVPAEFVLRSLRLERMQLPIRPKVFEGNVRCWVNAGYHGFDWDWTLLSVLYRYANTAKAYRDLATLWKATATNVWVTIVDDPWSERAEYDWLLLESEVAAMVASDFGKRQIGLRDSSTLFLLTEDAKVFAAHGGAYCREELFLSEKILPAGEEFHWPDWVTLITSRHRDTDWGPDLAEVFEKGSFGYSYSFYSFCVESWRDYIFDQLQTGTDKAVGHVLESMRMLDDMGYGPGDQNITVYDDLAMVFYADHPPAWIFRLYQFMDPLELWIDMTTQEGMDALRLKAMRRDSGVGKKRKGR